MGRLSTGSGPASYTVRARNLAAESDNKIHDDDVARRFGFTGALVPGVEVFAYATQPFVAEWGEDFLTRGEIAVRFRRPVYDGEDVTVSAALVDGDDDSTDRVAAVSVVDVVQSGLQREESRGAHQRTDFPTRDDERFLTHQLVHRSPDGTARVELLPVTITRWPPGERVYGR